MITYISRWSEIQRLLAAADHLRLNEEPIQAIAQSLRDEAGPVAVSFTDDPREYPHESPPTNDENTLQFFLLLGALSFCIWQRQLNGTVGTVGTVVAWSINVDGESYIGARGLATALMRALRDDWNLYDPTALQRLTLADVVALFRDETTQATTLQMLPERLAKLHELGNVLVAQYDGHVRTLFERSEGWLYRQDGQGVIQQLLTNFPLSFGDLPFAKLAQLTVKFMVGRRRPWIPTTPEFERLTQFHDLANALDASADYYIPFFFLRVGLLQADERLLDSLRRRELLGAMRCSSKGIVPRLWSCVGAWLKRQFSIADLDTLVWKQGYLRCRPCHLGVTDRAIALPHRADCRAFQKESSLMEIGWPLVHTPWY